nr:type IV pilus secretin PilQ [Geomonas silvestris]
MALSMLVMSSAGCVKRMSAANEPSTASTGFATLRSVTVSPDASRIELASDKPFTYTSYKAGEPAKVVVDISQTDPGQVASSFDVNRGNVRRIDVLRQPVGGGVLTRVEVSLVKDADFMVATDPADKTKLIVSMVAPEAKAAPAEVKPAPALEAKEPPLAEARIEEKSLPAEAPAAAAAETAPAADPAKPAAADPASSPAAPEKPADHPAAVASAAGVAAGSLVSETAPQGAAQQGGRRLTAVNTGADGVELAVAGGVLTFNSFKLAKPDRIVVDLFGVKNALGQKVVPVGALGIANVRIGSTPDKLRIVLDATEEKTPAFDVVKTDAGLKVRLGAAAGKPAPALKAAPAAPVAAAAAEAAPVVPVAKPVAAPAAAPEQAAPAVKPAPKSHKAAAVAAAAHGKGTLESLDFNVVDGVSRITMKLSGGCEAGKPVRGAQGLSLSIANCQVPKKLQRALDTAQFGSPVLSVTPYQVKVKGSNVAKLLVRLRGNPPFTVRQEGDMLFWDVTNPGPLPAAKLPAAPVRAREAQPAEPQVADELLPAPRQDDMVTEIPTVQHATKKVYKGRRVTLEFSDADIRKIFQLIAEVSNLNFLIADDVTGTISIKLVNVPWDQALDVILDAKGLGMQREGNIVQIKPKAKIQTQADEELAAKKAAERGMELRTMVFEVNYASTSDVATQFAALKSDRGTITKDDRTSRVIVKDIQTALDEMRALLRNLDTPEKQVMIEARIVEATSTFTRDLGVQWGLSYKDGSASTLGINSLDTTFGGVVSTAGPGTTGSGGIGMGVSFGKLTSNIQIDMRLAAAATIGQVKIISTPKVVTLNNKAAKISQGQSIPYQTTSAEGTKTEFVEAALTLEVTPHITADGSVSMKIKASNNSPGTGSPPPINKKEATTELVVANGETTVIGGIYVDSDTESDTGVPFLADIPLLGWLFKSNSKTKTKTELLIFITPKLIQ